MESLAALARLLQDPCYLVLSFLSGARDSEIKHLRRGSLTIERDADGTAYRWKMRSLAFKAEDDPAGVTYWKVFHGIRMTGMPSFHHTLSEQQIWEVTLFLQNMDKPAPKAAKAWKPIPSPAPAQA